jgi:hypothetical protein
MATKYEVWRGDTLLGTVDSTTLKTMAGNGKVRPDDVIRAVGQEKAYHAGEIPGLRPHFEHASPVQAQPQVTTQTPMPQGATYAQAMPAGSDPNDPPAVMGDATAAATTSALVVWGLRLTGAFCFLFAFADFTLYKLGIHDLWLAIPFISDTSLSMGTAIVVGFIGGFLLNLARGDRSAIDVPAFAGGIVVSAVLALVGLASLVALGMGALDIAVVKSGTFQACSGSQTIEQLLTHNYDVVDWEYLISDEDEPFIETTCHGSENGTARLQWEFISEDEFYLYYAEVNGSPVDTEFLILVLCNSM